MTNPLAERAPVLRAWWTITFAESCEHCRKAFGEDYHTLIRGQLGRTWAGAFTLPCPYCQEKTMVTVKREVRL